MWHTPDGDRVLTGAEEALFRKGVELLLIEIEQDGTVGLDVFDALSRGAQLALLHTVSVALQTKAQTAPVLTALNEATIAAIYLNYSQSLEMEAEATGGSCTDLRKLVLATCSLESDEEMPDPSCPDIQQWEMLIDTCMDRILWDRDFERGDEYLDASPEEAEMRKELLDIDADYYVAVPPDPSPREIEEHRRRLKKLIG